MTVKSYHLNIFYDLIKHLFTQSVVLRANTLSYNENMFFISFIVCIIFSVITVQPIVGAIDVNSHALTQTSHAEDNGQVEIISDSYVEKKMNVTKSTNSSDNLSKLPADKAKNGTTHNRKVTYTGVELAPAISEHSSNKTKNSTELNSDKGAMASNSSHAISDATVKSNQTTISGHLNPAVIDQLRNHSESKPKPVSNISSSTKIATSTATTTTTTTTSTTPTTSSTTTTSTTTTQKPTTTTPIPKKPLITFAVEDVPGLLTKVAESPPQLPPKEMPILEDIGINGPISLESSETPDNKSNNNFLVAMIGIIVVIPLIIIFTNCAVRQVRDVWSKRRYRRMDYLIEDMYN